MFGNVSGIGKDSQDIPFFDGSYTHGTSLLEFK